ncbi:unnamed protein product [Anisakis simplex]|uniref:Uncharacterized protein n=1 Tax=Anisakis simplex TaxID=6269 RepID=A0A158PPD1_ANISI|nr:unnamed protein product [Anisakis simplex]
MFRNWLLLLLDSPLLVKILLRAAYHQKILARLIYSAKSNCTSNRCLFESPTPALSLDFYTTQLNKAPGTRFTAKLYSTSTAFDEEHSLITDWGIVLVVTAVFLIVLLSISYLFYMKRNLLLRRIFNLLSNSAAFYELRSGESFTYGGVIADLNGSALDASKSAQAKKKEASGCDKTAPIYRRQPRTSIPSVHIPNFEPMPTIAEEDNEVAESDASSVPNSRRNSSLERPSIRVL